MLTDVLMEMVGTTVVVAWAAAGVRLAVADVVGGYAVEAVGVVDDPGVAAAVWVVPVSQAVKAPLLSETYTS